MMCALGIPFILEQPGSSVMEHHPCFKFVTKKKDLQGGSELDTFGTIDE